MPAVATLPRSGKRPAAWLTDRFYGFLAVRTDRSDDYPSRDEPDTFRANMSIKRKVFDQVGLFDINAPQGNVLASGEDGEMFQRILASGFKVMFLGQSRYITRLRASG